jgi:hypothetical protein
MTVRVTLAAMRVQRSLRGAIAGAVAATIMALEQPLDKRLFESDYDEVELLGKLVTRGDEWQAVGFAMHVQNGAIFGAVYAEIKPFLPGPAVVRGLLAALVENTALWPGVALVDRFHPARKDLPRLSGNRRAFAQTTFRHAVFGIVLGLLENVLNDRSADEPPEVPVSQNGHGNIERAVAGASA